MSRRHNVSFLLACRILTGDTVLWVPLSMSLAYVMNNDLDTVVTNVTDTSNTLYMYFFPISNVVVTEVIPVLADSSTTCL